MSVKSRNGSVLMEFLLVFPLYLTLMGGVFAIGDMLGKTIRLAAADRLMAMCPDSHAAESRYYLNHKLFTQGAYTYLDDLALSAKIDVVNDYQKTYRTDENFQGSWSWQTAAQCVHQYALPPWTRGWLLFPVLNWNLSVGEDSGFSQTILGKLLTVGSLIRVPMVSMEKRTVRAYYYYSLKRTKMGMDSYRSWAPKNLTDSSFIEPVFSAVWFNHVYGEPYADPNPELLDNANQRADHLPSKSRRNDYVRFKMFMLWSQ